jgi:hypothetical protein
MNCELFWEGEECFLLIEDYPHLSSSTSWKKKEGAILTVGLHIQEYSDSEQTQFLKTIITNGLRLHPKQVDFYVFEEKWQDPFSLEVPRSFFLVFDPSSDKSQFYFFQHRYICKCPSLASLQRDITLKREAWNQMKKLLASLHSSD